MTDSTRALVAQMRESLSGAVEWLESEGLDLGSVGEGFNQAIAAADQWLESPPTNQCGETCERAKLCATCARGLGHPSLPPQVPNEHGHLLTTAALWDMHIEEPAAPAARTKEETMKLEIEITEDEIRSAVERKVRTAVADQTNRYRWNVDSYIKERVKEHCKLAVDSYIKERVKEHCKLAVDALVSEALNDSKTLREKIAAELEKKLRAQLAAALKNAA